MPFHPLSESGLRAQGVFQAFSALLQSQNYGQAPATMWL